MCAVLDSWDQSRARRGRIPSLGCLASDLLTLHGASLKVWWPYWLFLSYRREKCAILLLCSQTFLQPLCPAPCRGIFPWNFSLSLWCWATTAGMSVIDQPLSWNTWSTVRSKALCSLNFLHPRHRFYEGGWGGMGWGWDYDSTNDLGLPQGNLKHWFFINHTTPRLWRMWLWANSQFSTHLYNNMKEGVLVYLFAVLLVLQQHKTPNTLISEPPALDSH